MSGSNEKRNKPTTGAAMNYFNGKVDIDSQNDKKFMAVKESAGDGVTAMNFYGENADAKVKSKGCVSMMTAGYEGKDLEKIADKFKEVTDGHTEVPQASRSGESKISLTVRVKSVRETIRLTLPDCSTVKAVVNTIKEKTGVDVQLRVNGGRDRILDEKKTLRDENIVDGEELCADSLATIDTPTDVRDVKNRC